MNTLGLLRSAIINSFRSKTRTTLTVVAIFLGAFTLTLTSAVGTGVNRYIDSTVTSLGATDVMTVTTAPVDTAEGPAEYNPDSTLVTGADTGPGGPAEIEAITPADLKEIAAVDGVLSVKPSLVAQPDYIQHDGGTQYQTSLGAFMPGMSLNLAAGEQPDSSASTYEVAIPQSYVSPLGYAHAADAVGTTVSIGVTNTQGLASVMDATVVGVSQAGLLGGDAITPNEALTQGLFDLQTVGLSETTKSSYAQAVVRFDPAATEAETLALQDNLVDLGFQGTTVTDQIGPFKTIIDAIVLILNGFAVIALLAAGFGIVNTLLMSVQERTREIGLMKAMGMSGGRIFGLFSFEAVFIGVLGSAVGIGLGMLGGVAANGLLSGGLLADLPGLTLVAFDPLALGTIVVIVVGIALLAGTIPALRAARQDPIEALRYE